MIKPERILLVDDDDTSNLLTSIILKRNIDAEVHSLLNGKEAIDYLSELKEGYPDLIFLDINMPLVNGFEFLEWFHENCMKMKAYVTMYSSSNREEDKEKAFAYDRVIHYIEKPINKEKISYLLNKTVAVI